MKASPHLPQLLFVGPTVSSAAIRCLLKRQSLIVLKPESWVAGCGALMGAGHTEGDANALLGHGVGLPAGAKLC